MRYFKSSLDRNVSSCISFKIFIVLLMLLSPAVVAQQYYQCDSLLKAAEEYYRTAYWNEAIELIQQCLGNKDISEADKTKSYRLLGLIYIATELETAAKDAIRNLLLMVPDYKINPDQDPPNFQKIISDVAPTLIPTIKSIEPVKAYRGESDIKLKVIGNNFSYGSIIQFNSNNKVTEYISSEEVIALLPKEDFTEGGEFDVKLISPILGGKSSNTVKFYVDTSSKPVIMNIGISGALSLPFGDFAGNSAEAGNGFASLGFGAIADLNVLIGVSGLGWMTSAGFFYNGFDDILLKETYYNSLLTGYLGSLNYNISNNITGYTSIPIMTGISYNKNISANFSFIVFGQGVFSIISGPGITSTLLGPQVTGTAEVSYDPSYSFGFGAGAGLFFNDFLKVSLRYLNLNNSERKYNVKINPSNLQVQFNNDYKINQSISVIVISAGVNF